MLLLYTFITITSITYGDDDIDECPRIHKAWHLTTQHEKNLYISALHKLNNEGKLARFATTHHFLIDSEQSHYTAAFFPWHRYFIWEFENQVRALGDEYKCFSCPYWDITHDAGQLEMSYIFRSGIGGIGDINNDLCVDIQDDGAWSRENYPLHHSCHTELDPLDNPENGCCLHRGGGGDGADVSGLSSYTNFILNFNNYGPMLGFRERTFMKYHGEAHGYVGGPVADDTQMISRYAPEDPAFFMLHTWLDYVFEVWKNCWKYNEIDAQDLDDYKMAYYPYPYDSNNFPKSGLDQEMIYVPMNNMDWWQGQTINPTPRKLWNPKDWNTAWERGTFIKNSHLTALCDADWDPDVLVENSDTTKEIIRRNIYVDGDDIGTFTTDVEEYEKQTWNHLQTLMTEEGSDEPHDYLQTWDAKTCNYQRQKLGKLPCYIPKDYEKCDESDKLRKDEITLDELLAKEGVSGNTCLEEVREKFYAYAKMMDMVYELCQGRFDINVCEIPKIDIIIDEKDDGGYYAKMKAIKQRIKEEQDTGDILSGDGTTDELVKDKALSKLLHSYPGFDIVLYVLIGMIIIGLVFIVLVKKCVESKIDGYNIQKPNKSQIYGSFYQMV